MTKALLFIGALSIAVSAQAKENVAKLQATLTTGYVESLKKSITLKTDDAGVWTVEIFTECEKYPCSVEDQTTRTQAHLTGMMDARAGDGPLELKFDNGMEVAERATGFGMLPPSLKKKTPMPPPYTLKIKIDGKDLTLPLSMSSSIHTNTYED